MAEIETKLEQSEVVSVKDEYEKTHINIPEALLKYIIDNIN